MKRRTFTIEDLKNFANQKGGKCLSDKYENANSKYMWEDEHGNRWEAKWSSIFHLGHWSPYTAQERKAKKLQKYSMNDLNSLAESKGGKCLSTEYINDKTKYLWEDSLGRQFSMSWWDVHGAGYWSPHEKKDKLSDLKKKYSIDDLRNFAMKYDGECLSTEYTGSRSVYEWKDSSGNVFKRPWHKVLASNSLCKYNDISSGQREVLTFLKEIGVKIINTNDRSVISPKEIDLFCPEYHIGIEFNGLKYHNTSQKEIYVDYHKDKLEITNSKNIDLIQIYDLEWNSRKNQVKSFLRAKFGKCSNKIYARNTEINEISMSIANDFLDKYHIIGKIQSGKCYGLFNKDELVSVLTVGNHPNRKSDECYLTRFCVKNNYYVIGGLSKMCKHVKGLHGKLYTYVDLRYSNGQNWLNLGWELVHKTKPIISYYDINRKVLHRNRNNNPDLVCVYDCGKLKLSF